MNLKSIGVKLSQIKKFLAAATGAAGIAISEGILSGSAQHWVTSILAVATAFVVYLVPNAPASASGK